MKGKEISRTHSRRGRTLEDHYPKEGSVLGFLRDRQHCIGMLLYFHLRINQLLGAKKSRI